MQVKAWQFSAFECFSQLGQVSNEVEVDLTYLKKYIRVERVMLFGSAVQGVLPHEFQDIDILVVSDSFRNVPQNKRKEIVRKCVNSARLDPLCLTVQQFNEMISDPSDFTKSIQKDWIEIG